MTRNDTPRIFVECTYTYFAGGTGGIRRVTRNLANIGMGGSFPQAQVYPLVWGGIGFFSPRRPLGERPHRLMELARTLRVLLGTVSAGIGRIVGLRPLRALGELILRMLGASGLAARRRAYDELFYRFFGVFALPFGYLFVRPVRFRPGDIVVLVDSTWNSPQMLQALFDAQTYSGVRVGAMLHDLFPLTIPEMCHEDSVRGYRQWFERVAPRADFFVTNSNATRNALDDHLARHPDLRRAPLRSGSFPLGASIQRRRDRSARAREPGRPPAESGFVVLAVGTIEPRKNYSCILGAFDLLCARHPDVSLVIIGRKGWKSDEMISRIADHPLNGGRLRHLDDADDDALADAYATADCLVCASWAEGFGLPVVEGLMHGVPVIASDIQVFHEVGGEACTYFPPDSPETLAGIIASMANARGPTRAPQTTPSRGSWIDWNESTSRFVASVLDLARPPGN